MLINGRGDAKAFLVLYAMTAYYFANKMNRLIILMGPVASALSGIAIGMTVEWAVRRVVGVKEALEEIGAKPETAAPAEANKEGGEAKDEAAPGTPAKDGSGVPPSPASAAKGGKGQGGSAASLAKAAAGKAKKEKKASAEQFTVGRLKDIMVTRPVRGSNENRTECQSNRAACSSSARVYARADGRGRRHCFCRRFLLLM